MWLASETRSPSGQRLGDQRMRKSFKDKGCARFCEDMTHSNITREVTAWKILNFQNINQNSWGGGGYCGAVLIDTPLQHCLEMMGNAKGGSYTV